MQFGIFDQNDRGPYELGQQYENRLKLIEFCDSAGFRTYHMSEHHCASALWFTCCPPITRCGSPKKSACSTISAMAGSTSE